MANNIPIEWLPIAVVVFVAAYIGTLLAMAFAWALFRRYRQAGQGWVEPGPWYRTRKLASALDAIRKYGLI